MSGVIFNNHNKAVVSRRANKANIVNPQANKAKIRPIKIVKTTMFITPYQTVTTYREG